MIEGPEMKAQAKSLQGPDHGLQGRVAAITGAGGGMAEALLDRFVELGAALVLLEANEASLDRAVNRMKSKGASLKAIVCDVSDESRVSMAAQQMREIFGKCDILINNAGVLGPPVPLEKLSGRDWDESLRANLQSVFLCTRYFGELMLEQRKGSIVNIGSIAARSPNACAPYSASKAGVLAFTRHTAVEWGPRGIRANSVSPGFVRTPLSERAYAGTDMLALRTAMVPLRRIGTAADVAAAAGFLASDAAAFITGQDLVVDGGFLQTALIHAQPLADQYGGILQSNTDSELSRRK
jgi:NAD(P)-dependent dehydrogenase (short-subunit alcohol dehydrogenase family)